MDAAQISALVFIRGRITIPGTNSVVNIGELSASVSAPYDNPPPSEAGTITCLTTANHATVDPAGLNERVGPILLQCSVLAPPGGIPAATTFAFDLGVRLTTDFAGPTTPGPNGSTLTAARVVIDGDEPSATIGELEASNQVKFRGLTLPIGPDVEQQVLNIAIENLGSNVAQLGIPNTATFPSTQVIAVLTIGGADLPMQRNVVNIGAPIGPSPTAGKDLAIAISCQATAVPPIVRAEGISELVGDIIFNCPCAPLPVAEGGVIRADISVSLNVKITNNVGFSGEGLTDAVLVVNENNCRSPSPVGGSFFTCSAFDPRFQEPQFDRLTTPNQITWEDVETPIPGFVPEGVDPMFRYPWATIRMSGIRANNSQLGIPSTATFPSTQITAIVGIARTESLTLTTNFMNVAVPILAMVPSLETDTQQGRSCTIGSGQTLIKLSEGFATAFKILGGPTFSPGQAQNETGYFAPGSNNGGGASQAIRALLGFEGVPRGPGRGARSTRRHGTIAR